MKVIEPQRCVYCTQELNQINYSRDHIVPRAFFSADNNGLQRMTVPACKKCNSEKSETENYLLATLVTSLSDPTGAFSELKKKAWKRIDPAAAKDKVEEERRRKILRSISKGLRLINTGEIKVGGHHVPMTAYPVPREGQMGVFSFEGDKLTIFLRMLVQALCFREFNQMIVSPANVAIQYMEMDKFKKFLDEKFLNVNLNMKQIHFGQTVRVDYFGVQEQQGWGYIFLIQLWKQYFAIGSASSDMNKIKSQS